MRKFLPLFILAITFALTAAHAEEEIQKVEIIVDSYSFTPDTITAKAGVPLEITLRSVSSISHTFTIDDPAHGLLIDQEVRGGRDAVVTFTPEKPGTYKIYCAKSSIFGSHEEKGMTGRLVVE